MISHSNVFVSNAEYISGIKSLALKDLLKIGSCLKTPLEKKATFRYLWSNINAQDMVTQVTFYAPGSKFPSQVINLRQENYIKLQDWYRMTRPVWEYPEFEEQVEETARIREIIKAFEEAAKIHGARQASVASGLISDPEPFLRESGKILKDAREAVYEEFNV